ncbi:MAG: CRISPR-associated helicase/endonuclease Cas3, partial [Clostridia bacterium]|nr:CRISPR-associated helicase/endonuclease Cas3 [Clostridia bacterium]
ENFHLIEDRTISIVVPTDKVGRELVECLRRGELVPERRLQSYTASITRWELDDLRKQGVIEDFGCGIYCLMNMDYYNSEVGIGFTGQDLFDS